VRDNPLVIDAYLGESASEVHEAAEHLRHEGQP
jgi:hypothetical protein